MAENVDKTTGKKPAEKKVDTAKKPVAAKAAEKAPPVKKAVVKKTPEKKADAPPAAGDPQAMKVTAEQRYRMVAEAAYYRAENNNFMSDPVRDWIEAEGDIAALLDGKK